MLGYIHTGQKGGRKWLAGIYLTKTIMNDVHVVAASQNAWGRNDAARMELASWEHGHRNLGGILAPAKTVKPQALPAPVILVAGTAARDDAASDILRPDSRDLPEACSVSQSRNSDASFLTVNPGGVATADAWAHGSCIIYGKCSSSVRTIESKE